MKEDGAATAKKSLRPGRPPIGKRPMTAAERRHRAGLATAREQSKLNRILKLIAKLSPTERARLWRCLHARGAADPRRYGGAAPA